MGPNIKKQIEMFVLSPLIIFLYVIYRRSSLSDIDIMNAAEDTIDNFISNISNDDDNDDTIKIKLKNIIITLLHRLDEQI